MLEFHHILQHGLGQQVLQLAFSFFRSVTSVELASRLVSPASRCFPASKTPCSSGSKRFD